MFSNPKTIVNHLGITPGMTIADVGSGSGEYSLALARAVGYSGKVYAIDIQKELLTKLKNQAQTEGINNIEIIWGDLEKENGTALADKTVDLCVLANVMFQVEDTEALIKETVRLVKDKGRVVAIDWTDSFGGLGPRPESVMSVKEVEEIFNKFEFKKKENINAGDHHFGLIFERV